MELEYSNKMHKCLKDDKTMRKNYGNLFEKIKVCLSVLEGADTLELVPNTPPTRRHKLTNGNWAVDLSPNWRLIIKPLQGEEPITIRKVEIIDIEDYH